MMIFRQNITNAGTHKSMNKKTKIDARLKERRLTACFHFFKWKRSSFCITQKTHLQRYGQSCVHQNNFK